MRSCVACEAEPDKGDLSDPGTELESGGEIRMFVEIRRGGFGALGGAITVRCLVLQHHLAGGSADC